MRTLAQRFNLSDVGLAKICKKYGIPRPPVGYWSKLKHGKAVKKPNLPSVQDGANEDVILEMKPKVKPRPKGSEGFFDSSLGALADQLDQGELVCEVGVSLRGCHEITRSSRKALSFGDKKPTRDRYGILKNPVRYTEPHVLVSVDKSQRQRALLLLDAVLKTLDRMGCKREPPRDDFDRSVIFSIANYRFRLRIRERMKRRDHEPTAEERQKKRQWGWSFAPKYDYDFVGDFFLEILYETSASAIVSVKDGKRAGLVETQIGRVAIDLLRHVDQDLRRAHDRKMEAERYRQAEEDRRKQEEEAREHERLRQEKLARERRLFELAERWEQSQRLTAFLDRLEESGAAANSEYGIEAGAWFRWARENDTSAFMFADLTHYVEYGVT